MVSSGSLLSVTEDEVTVTRTIGNLAAFMNTISAGVNARVALGCIIARGEAITAGVASLPSPEDDPDAEWLFYTQFDLRTPAASSPEGTIAPTMFREHFDVRGQRILRVGSQLVWIGESQDNNVIAGVGGRYLVKLP